MSFGTAYGQRGSRRGTVAQGNVHIDPKSGKIIGITGRGNPLARGISSSILGSSGGGGRLPLGRATLSSSMARAAMSVFSRGRIRMNSGGMVPGGQMMGYRFGSQAPVGDANDGGMPIRGGGGMGMMFVS